MLLEYCEKALNAAGHHRIRVATDPRMEIVTFSDVGSLLE